MLPQGLSLDQTQNTWATMLDPIIMNALVRGQQLNGVKLISGTTVINHKLGRKLQGWFIVDLNGAAQVYRTNATTMPDLTLTLVSNAAVTVSLWVF